MGYFKYDYMCICIYVSDIVECESSPCQNGGSCTDGVNQYSCSCSPRYESTNCNTGEFC